MAGKSPSQDSTADVTAFVLGDFTTVLAADFVAALAAELEAPAAESSPAEGVSSARDETEGNVSDIRTVPPTPAEPHQSSTAIIVCNHPSPAVIANNYRQQSLSAVVVSNCRQESSSAIVGMATRYLPFPNTTQPVPDLYLTRRGLVGLGLALPMWKIPTTTLHRRCDN